MQTLTEKKLAYKLRDIVEVPYVSCTCVAKPLKTRESQWYLGVSRRNGKRHQITKCPFATLCSNATRTTHDNRQWKMDCLQYCKVKKISRKSKWSTVDYSKNQPAYDEADAVSLARLERHRTLRAAFALSYTEYTVLNWTTKNAAIYEGLWKWLNGSLSSSVRHYISLKSRLELVFIG